LGAGKTPVLNSLLRSPELAKAAVIVNEFGDIGLDQGLVASAGDEVIALTNGCICCSVRGELVTMLEGVLRDIDNGRLAPIDRLIIETTGLAEPLPILQTLIAHPYLHLRFAIAGVVTVIAADTA